MNIHSDSCSLPSHCRFVRSDGTLRVEWIRPIKNVLVVHKFCDNEVIKALESFILHMLKHYTVTIWLEAATLSELHKEDDFYCILHRYLLRNGPLDMPDTDLTKSGTKECPQCDSLHDSANFTDSSNALFLSQSSVAILDPSCQKDKNMIDLVVCLGGDGTLLHLASLFQSPTPPILAFRLGTVGFLTPFQFNHFPQQLDHIFKGSVPCILRMRLRCQILRSARTTAHGSTEDDCEPTNSSSLGDCFDESGRCCRDPEGDYHFLNEVVIDRGMSPSLCEVVIKVYGQEVTHIRGDGLIISTPTGSTAYSMAAGSSLLHPCVPALLITPINSMSLNSRALVLPACAEVSISLAPTARASAVHISCDGRPHQSNFIKRGDVLSVSASPYPVPCLCSENQLVDWFCDLAQCLSWNVRGQEMTTKQLIHEDYSKRTTNDGL